MRSINYVELTVTIRRELCSFSAPDPIISRNAELKIPDVHLVRAAPFLRRVGPTLLFIIRPVIRRCPAPEKVVRRRRSHTSQRQRWIGPSWAEPVAMVTVSAAGTLIAGIVWLTGDDDWRLIRSSQLLRQDSLDYTLMYTGPPTHSVLVTIADVHRRRLLLTSVNNILRRNVTHQGQHAAGQ